jgi:hypothetical protein
MSGDCSRHQYNWKHLAETAKAHTPGEYTIHKHSRCLPRSDLWPRGYTACRYISMYTDTPPWGVSPVSLACYVWKFMQCLSDGGHCCALYICWARVRASDTPEIFRWRYVQYTVGVCLQQAAQVTRALRSWWCCYPTLTRQIIIHSPGSWIPLVFSNTWKCLDCRPWLIAQKVLQRCTPGVVYIASCFNGCRAVNCTV